MDSQLNDFLDGAKESFKRFLCEYTKDRDLETRIAAGKEFLELFQEMIVQPYSLGMDVPYASSLNADIEVFQQAVAKKAMGITQ